MDSAIRESCIHSIWVIENDEQLSTFLRASIKTVVKKFSLSKRKILILENLNKFVIQCFGSNENDIYKSKLETIMTFLKTHPWIEIDYDKPSESLNCLFGIIHRAAGNLSEDEYIVIRSNGELETREFE